MDTSLSVKILIILSVRFLSDISVLPSLIARSSDWKTVSMLPNGIEMFSSNSSLCIPAPVSSLVLDPSVKMANSPLAFEVHFKSVYGRHAVPRHFNLPET